MQGGGVVEGGGGSEACEKHAPPNKRDIHAAVYMGDRASCVARSVTKTAPASMQLPPSRSRSISD